ncbi:MAG: dihydrofolate reductase [Sporolactobacillus sp.]
MISFLLAMDANQLIGNNNQLPWHLPDDLRYFKQKTMGHTVIMGRKTFESIGKPLSGRENIVISHRQTDIAGVRLIHSVNELLSSKICLGRECFVIGGAQIFDLLAPYADRLYVTQIHAEFEGDTYFRSYQAMDWKRVTQEPGRLNAKNKYPHTFEVYERC